jgi:hypothetical protein
MFASINEAISCRKCPICNILPAFTPDQFLTTNLLEKELVIYYDSFCTIYVNRENSYIGKVIKYPTMTDPPLKEYDGGTLYQGIKLSCRICEKYHLSLTLEIGLYMDKVNSIKLGSETIRIENQYLKNVYETNQTEYTFNGTTISLPLMSNNLNNYNDILKRIRKLINFS